MRRPLLCALLAAALLLTAHARAAQTVWLDQLDVRLSTCGWRSTQKRRAVGGRPLSLRGTRYERGIGTHAPGELAIELAGGSTRFAALAGIDDETGGGGSAEFQIVADGKLLWSSGVVRGRDPAKKVDVDVTGVKRLRLVVTVAGDGFGNDHTDWADARFTVVGARPKAIGPPKPAALDTAQRIFRELRGKSKRLAPETYHPAALAHDTDRDATDAIIRRTDALLQHLKTMEGIRDLAPEQKCLDAIRGENAKADPKNAEERTRLYERAKTLRRRIAFANPLLNFDKILFLKKPFPRVGHMCDQYFGFMAIPEGGLCVLENAFGDEPTVRDVLADAVCENGRFKGKKLLNGGFIAPDLSYDGNTILFAWTEAERTGYKWTERSTYHIFKVNVDGTGLRQLTDGPVNDLDPCWMPNGRIVLISERRGGYGRCHGRPVPIFTLHTMNADGSDIVCISFHESNEWHPGINHEGMIVYTRWDYVDRGHGQAHHPWITTPDGRDARAIHGNFAPRHNARTNMEMDVRAIPGSHKYVATATGHHTQSYGSLVIVDPNQPDDDAMQPIKRFTPDVGFPESQGGRLVYATAWPLNEQFLLCVYDASGGTRRRDKNSFGIYLVDAFGNKVLLYRDPAISCLSPIPLRPRPTPPVIPHATLVGRPNAPTPKDLPKTAPVGVVNVYDSLLALPKDTRIAALRIVQVLPKTTPPANNPRIGHGSQKSARAVLGTVPVEADGSAHFRLPVNIPVYFQTLDPDGLAVQSMRSDTYVHPGDRLTCQGCHDPRHRRSSLDRTGTALQRPPSTIQPDVDGSNPFSFPRLVQPVLDRHCVPCHIKEKKAIDLRKGDWKRNRNRWYTSYISLRRYAFFFDPEGWTTPRTIPGKFGARASKLYQMLAKGHNKLQLPKEDLHRITLWLDANSDFFGSYENTEAQSRGEIVHPTLE